MSQMFEGNGARLGKVRRLSGVRVLPCMSLFVSAALFASSLLKQTLQTLSQVLKIEEKFSHLCILVPTLLVEKILNMCAGETATVNLHRLIVCFSGWQEVVLILCEPFLTCSPWTNKLNDFQISNPHKQPHQLSSPVHATSVHPKYQV